MKIFLLGYMGCGKSTIGKILAKELDIKFLDFDQYLEKNEQTTIKELFTNKGEIYFRRLETQMLEKILQIPEDCVISLGGGTPCYGNNINIIKDSGVPSVYINVSIEELTSRLWKARAHRPLLQHQDTPEKLEEYIRKHLFERSFYYNQADYKISAGSKTAGEIAQEIRLRVG